MKLKIISLLLVGFFGVLVSCMEDAQSISGKGTNRFRLNASGEALTALDPVAGTYTLIDVWRDVVSSGALNKSASVDVVLDDQIVADYNAANGEANEVPPADAIEIVTSTINYEAGDFNLPIEVSLTPENIDFSKSYAFGIRLENPSDGYETSADHTELLIKVVVKNQYDAVYKVYGTRWNFSTKASAVCGSGAPPSGFISSSTFSWEERFSTVNATTNKISAGNLNNSEGAGFGNFTIETNGSTVVLTDIGTGLNLWKEADCYESSYDPIAKKYTIYEEWTNTSGTHRIVQKFIEKK